MFTQSRSKSKVYIARLLAVLAIGATFCLEASADEFAYKLGQTRGVSAESVDSRHLLQGKDSFRLMLQPAEGNAWNMESVSVLGIQFKNTGKTELVLDLMVRNDGATGWSNSALGRTIVKPGEELPLGVSLCRAADYATTHPAYLRMSGKPDGTLRHWHHIDPAKVKGVSISCASKGPHSFELGPMFALQPMKPELMGVFPFIDQYGQYMFKEWPGKVHSDADFKKQIKAEENLVAELGEPSGFSKYGGWKDGPKLEATGFFRTQKHKDRWWFVDPEGYLFWSFGAACVGLDFASQSPLDRDLIIFKDLPEKSDPELGPFYTAIDVEDNYKLREDVPHFDFSRANLFKKYGKDWEKIYMDQELERLEYCRLNTIGAWSDTDITEKRQLPYNVMLHYEYAFAALKLPDPFAPETRAGIRKALEEYPVNFKNDPWCLGAFVNNELHWKNNTKALIQEVLGYDKEDNTPVRKVFRDWLKEKYTTVQAFNEAWEISLTSWDDLLEPIGAAQLKKMNGADCSALTTLLADAFYKLVSEELEAYSPNTLYLGSRCNSGSKEVILASAKYVDVVSANIYSYTVNLGTFGSSDKPVLISEFHYANVGGNNLGSGLRSAQNAVQQGRLFKKLMEDAVNHPQVVGGHWFQWRDHNAAGRYDGENYNVGFFEVTDGPNNELIRAAAAFGDHLYDNAN